MNTVTENNAGKKRLFYIGALAATLVLVLAACQGGGYGGAYGGGAGGAYGAQSSNANAAPAAPAPTSAPAAIAAAMPSVSVADQPIKDDTVTVAKVVSNGPGWIVIHADKNGAPGPVLGHAAVKDGENDNVTVKLAAEGRTSTLYAMLHTDAGKVGTYEFPGADVPVTMNGAAITPAFKVTGGESQGTAPSQATAASQGAVAGQSAAIKLANFKFTPAQLTVKVGTTVVWTSEDNVPHTVTADDGSFDSGNLKKGDSFSFTFTKAGTFPYYCAYHGTAGGGGMSGTITVTN
jgi:plastocyanin